MKLQIEIKRIVISLMFVIGYTVCYAQATTSNPLEYTAIGIGEANVGQEITRQQVKLDTLAAVHGVMLAAEAKMNKWEAKYNSYLKTAEGYASSIQAASTLYLEGMQTLQALWEINTACELNPQGIATTISMNTLYAETAVELVKIFRILKKVVARGGEENMLNGAERTKVLWQLNDEIYELNKKLRSLALSICIYDFEDVWNRAIAGKIQKSNRTLAKEALKRQQKAANIVTAFYRKRQQHFKD